MNKKIGFIGCGKMAQAMIKGILSSGRINKEQLMASAATTNTVKLMEERFNISLTTNNVEVAQFADILILAVKPMQYGLIIEEIREKISRDAIIVTIAAGITLHDIEVAFKRKMKTVRTMPNTPSLVGEGMSVLCPNDLIKADDLENIKAIFNSFGKSEILEEKLMDAVPAISGSSPAYVYMFIEALADGGVKRGIPRRQAYQLAAQSVLGAAKMVLETHQHPGSLKDDVCTPGGATIEAVAELENKRFRGAVLSAMDKCYEKTTGMASGGK